MRLRSGERCPKITLFGPSRSLQTFRDWLRFLLLRDRSKNLLSLLLFLLVFEFLLAVEVVTYADMISTSAKFYEWLLRHVLFRRVHFHD